MESPLWTRTHAPDLAHLPQPAARETLGRAVDEPVNLVVSGPKGCGKTAAVRALARKAHADLDTEFVELNVADVFQRTKAEIRADPRFEPFLQGAVAWTKRADVDTKYKRELSKADMLKHVLAEQATHAASAGSYRTILLDNAEAIRTDFQQALRRIIERNHRTTQIVLATRQPSTLIPAIRSRCLPVAMRAPTVEETVGVLERIATAEEIAFDAEGLEYVAGYGSGDLRRAVLGAQTTAEAAGEITINAAHEALSEVDTDARVEEMVAAAEAGRFIDARNVLDELLTDEGLSGEEVLDDLLRVGRTRYAGEDLAWLYRLAGEIDRDMVAGTTSRVHLSHLLAELGREAA